MLKIEESWKKVLGSESEQKYFQTLTTFVKNEYNNEKVFPPVKDIFRAFDLCPFDQVKVVILGQDPYHGVGQANGLSFAVATGIPLPPSLKNIFKEIESDIGVKPFVDGDLSRWASQGVLLLNATLTVRASSPGSHQKVGWESFTDVAVRALSEQKEHLVFLLWGNYAKEKGKIIDRKKHLVLEAAHPSPFSAYNGFFGCKHFSKANEYLKKNGLPEIDWR
ncbi:MAG: Uracil-DNA glycosylase [Candidatus Parcubacteria bacterium]|jgi:uracil-DNA glycosylase